MGEISTKEKLILAGIEELRSYGMRGFSLRRVASSCGVSCAAPYKHFAGKQELFSAMVAYVNDKWIEKLKTVVNYRRPVENVIAECAVNYVSFLSDNPHFKSVLLIKQTGLDEPNASLSVGTSVPLRRLFVIYGRKHELTKDELRSRIFIVRSLVYGAAIAVGAEESRLGERLSNLRHAVLNALK